MTMRFLRTTYLLAALAWVAGCMPGGSSLSPPLVVAPSNPQQAGQPSKEGQEAAGTESHPSSDSAVSLGLLIDVSGSMRPKMDWAVEALQAFLNSLHSQDEVFLLTFHRLPTLVQPFTADRGKLNEAVAKLRASNPVGGTALYDAVLEGLRQVSLGKHPQKALLVLTDGWDTASLASQSFMLRAVESAKVPIYSIGIGDPHAFPDRLIPYAPLATAANFVDGHTLRTLGDKTKGTHFLLDVTDPAGHTTVLLQALDSISHALHEAPAGAKAP